MHWIELFWFVRSCSCNALARELLALLKNQKVEFAVVRSIFCDTPKDVVLEKKARGAKLLLKNEFAASSRHVYLLATSSSADIKGLV